ncbi:hypothetical protein [Sporanaerobium hydrogeniformans]|uniref:hypothetical protein n=1 Tax=Sporanaerobium hydrogeniformans TaxID=3072179 RepID=UPI0015D4818C|nr:hypothetical protein [Sporanaerobium hydrogeniformans]
MENYFYKCEVCGFVHLIPAYWVSFNPERMTEFLHINKETGRECTNSQLLLMDAISE